VKTKNDNSNSNIDSIFIDNTMLTDNEQIGNAFNKFFTTIVSNSNASKIECANFIFHYFREIKNNFLQTKTEFNFTEINNDITEDNLREISADSSPGISNIPSKILLRAKSKLIPILTTLFNECIKSSYIPFDNFRQSPSYLRKLLPSKFHLFLKTTIYCLTVNMVLDMELDMVLDMVLDMELSPKYLRNTNHLTRYQVNLKEGKKTFHYFFSKFINSYYVNKFHLKFSLFKRFVFDNFDFICFFIFIIF
jgi:hypothetical protein